MTGGAWWSGMRLVAGRAIAEALASKSWRVVTVLMLLLGVAFIVVPRLIGDSAPRYTLAVVGASESQVQGAFAPIADAGGFSVDVVPVPDASAAEAAVREGRADAALAPGPGSGTLFVAADSAGTFPALVSQAVLAQATAQALLDAGLQPDQVAAIQTLRPPEQVWVGRVADEGRAGVGFAVGIVLYMSLILTGTSIATAVATEKTTKISEVLLAVLRPSQLLVGTVLGVGLLGLAQVAALGVPVTAGLLAGGGLEISSAAAGDVVLGLGWFVLGLLVYAFVFAALATLVEKVTEVGAATLPVNAVLIGSYLLAVTVTIGDPNGWPSVIASLFPLSAPMVMPVRWASGLVPGWQLALSMALTLGCAILLAALASRIYARGLATAGRRLRLREVLRP